MGENVPGRGSSVCRSLEKGGACGREERRGAGATWGIWCPLVCNCLDVFESVYIHSFPRRLLQAEDMYLLIVSNHFSLPSRATFILSLKFTRSPHLHILHLTFIRFREVNPLAQGYGVSGDSFSPSLPSFFSYFLSLACLSFLQN